MGFAMRTLLALLGVAAAVDLDETVRGKLTKVRDITKQINDASKQVMVLQDKNWLPGSDETTQATQQLQALLQKATATNAQLQLGLSTLQGKATAANLKLSSAKAASDSACAQLTPCDLAAQKASDIRINEMKEVLQDYEVVNQFGEMSAYSESKPTAQSIKERQDKYLQDLMAATKEMYKICHDATSDYTPTPCQQALNITTHAQWDQVAAQQLVDACTTSGEKLVVSIKRAEELLRPLELGEQRLFQQHLSPATRWPWMASHRAILLGLSLVAMFAALSLVAVLVRSRMKGTTRALVDEETLIATD